MAIDQLQRVDLASCTGNYKGVFRDQHTADPQPIKTCNTHRLRKVAGACSSCQAAMVVAAGRLLKTVSPSGQNQREQ